MGKCVHIADGGTLFPLTFPHNVLLNCCTHVHVLYCGRVATVQVRHLTGEIVPVEDTVYDFLTPHEIGARIGSLQKMPKKGYDDIFCIIRPRDKEGEMINTAKYVHVCVVQVYHDAILMMLEFTLVSVWVCCRLNNPKNGLSLSVSTDQLVVVMYTGNYLDKIHTGVCLETQNYPDSVNRVSCLLQHIRTTLTGDVLLVFPVVLLPAPLPLMCVEAR